MNELLLYETNSAFDHSLWSRYEWLSLLEFSKRLQWLHHKHIDTYGYSAVQDAYYALADENPNLSKAGMAWNRVMALPEFPHLQEMISTRNSKANVINWLATKFVELFYEDPPPPDEAEGGGAGGDQQDNDDNDDDDDDEDRDRQEELDKLKDAQAKSGTLRQEQIDQARKEIEKQTGGDDDDGDEEGGEVEANPQAGPVKGSNIKIPTKIALNVGELQDLEEENEISDMMAGLFPGSGETPMGVRDFIELHFDRMALRRAAKILGWGQRVMAQAKRQNQGATGEMVGFNQSSWSDNVDPTEMAAVAEGDLHALVKLAESNLRTKVYDEHKALGKGGVIFMHDESGSMKGGWETEALRSKPNLTDDEKKWLQTNPSKDIQAINLQVALAALVRAEGRPFTAIAWDDDTTRVHRYGDPGLDKHLTQFLDGGTNINHALYKAFDIVDSDPKHRKGTDIVVCTDGMIGDAPQNDLRLFMRLSSFKKDGGRIWVIYVGGELKPGSGYYKHMSEWADAIVSVDNLFDDPKLAEIFRRVATDTQKHKRRMV